MKTKILLITLSITCSICAAEYECCQDDIDENYCLVGSLDFNLKDPEAQHFNICYDGTIVRVDNGIYCFKEQKDVDIFYVLFVDPDVIGSINKHNAANTTDHLTFVSNSPYHLYRLKLVEGSSDQYTWHIKQKPMPKSDVGGTVVAVIPDHTLIIPIENKFFKKNENGCVLFTYKALKSEGNIIKLPTPIIAGNNKELLKQAILKANMCMVNLGTIHAKQTLREVNLDKHRLVQ